MRILLIAVTMIVTLRIHADDGAAFREAQARLEAKRKAATTQATTQPTDNPEVASLRQTILMLKAQNDDLRKQIADLKHPAPLVVNHMKPWESVKVGMSYDDVERIRHSGFQFEEKPLGENETTKSIEWIVGNLGSCIIDFDKASNTVAAINITAP